MKEHKALNVFHGDRRVGILATTADQLVAFEYVAEWLRDGFSISPISLPLQKGVFAHNRDDHSKNFSI